jgi:predicted PhzF superfamily epimerase YddE/YHI9
MQPRPEAGSGTPAAVDGEPVDYLLRFFAPGLGIAEDPVTGSAHALVAPWWQGQLGRSRVVGWQCSDRPGGVVCEGLPSGKIRLFGSGHLLWDGTLNTHTPADPPSRRSIAFDGDPSEAGSSWQALLRHA